MGLFLLLFPMLIDHLMTLGLSTLQFQLPLRQLLLFLLLLVQVQVFLKSVGRTTRPQSRHLNHWIPLPGGLLSLTYMSHVLKVPRDCMTFLVWHLHVIVPYHVLLEGTVFSILTHTDRTVIHSHIPTAMIEQQVRRVAPTYHDSCSCLHSRDRTTRNLSPRKACWKTTTFDNKIYFVTVISINTCQEWIFVLYLKCIFSVLYLMLDHWNDFCNFHSSL